MPSIGSPSIEVDLGRQLVALGDVDELFTEKISGKSREKRTELERMLQYVRKGDQVRVQSQTSGCRAGLAVEIHEGLTW